MKVTFLSLVTACVLLTSGAAVAQDHRDGRQDQNSNYGFDKNHKVTPQERARWEAEHKNDRHDDKNDHHDGKNNQHDERNDKGFNYGFDKNHKVTPQERARWDAAHKNDHR